jgi:hypothetical protein
MLFRHTSFCLFIRHEDRMTAVEQRCAKPALFWLRRIVYQETRGGERYSLRGRQCRELADVQLIKLAGELALRRENSNFASQKVPP